MQVPKGGWRAPEEPHIVMPAQYSMLKYFCNLKQPGRQEHLFSLLPLKQGFTTSNVKVCSTSLHQLLKRNDIETANNEVQFLQNRSHWWGQALQMKKVKALRPGWQFHDEVTTDGCAISILFSRKIPKAEAKPRPPVNAAELNLSDFDLVRLQFCT